MTNASKWGIYWNFSFLNMFWFIIIYMKFIFLFHRLHNFNLIKNILINFMQQSNHHWRKDGQLEHTINSWLFPIFQIKSLSLRFHFMLKFFPYPEGDLIFSMYSFHHVYYAFYISLIFSWLFIRKAHLEL